MFLNPKSHLRPISRSVSERGSYRTVRLRVLEIREIPKDLERKDQQQHGLFRHAREH